MRIETRRPELPVHVSPSGESVELGIGEPSGGTWLVTALSLPQAEMVLHALGLAVAQIKPERGARSAASRRCRSFLIHINSSRCVPVMLTGRPSLMPHGTAMARRSCRNWRSPGCTWHYALNDYAGQRRLMRRITIGGAAGMVQCGAK